MIRYLIKFITWIFRIWIIFYFLNGLKFVQDINSSNYLLELTEIHKCPFCYGNTACRLFDSNKIILNHQYIVCHLINKKNVYHGFLNNQKVILKKLASNRELFNFDETIQENTTIFINYLNNYNLLNNIMINREIINKITLKMDNPNIKLRVCPKIDNFNIQFIETYIRNSNNIKLSTIYLWTVIKINPEPLILKILSAENGWPFPKYYGSCGRVVIVEDVGPSLISYYYDSWLCRAKIASSMLDAAYILTFKNPKFAIYLTDISPDNIAVDKTNNAKFIDLEHIIIVDRTSADNQTVLNKVHKSSIINSNENSFSFSPTDICLHKTSDHNFYSICQILWQRNSTNMYGENFLHSVPANILQHYPELMDLMRQCSIPDSVLDNRILFGIKLNYVLRRIISYYESVDLK